MKKILFFVLCHSAVFAQRIKFDDLMLGYTTTPIRQFTLSQNNRRIHSVMATYYFSPHLGLNLQYGQNGFKSDSSSFRKATVGLKVLSLGLFQNRLFLQGFVGVSSLRNLPTNIKNGSIDERALGISPGLLIRPMKRLSVDVSFFTYQHSITRVTGNGFISHGQNTYLRPQLGINYIFYKNKKK